MEWQVLGADNRKQASKAIGNTIVLFMGVLRLGPAGAALGTTFSQAVSVLVSMIVIIKRKSVALVRTDFKPYRPVMGKILSIGIPIAVQDGLI